MGHHVSPTRPDGSPYAVALSEDEWAARLSPDERKVLREGGTERPFVGEFTDTRDVGVYSCRACDAELFRSETKFDSHCGWPSFFSPLAGDVDHRDRGHVDGDEAHRGPVRVMRSHLGHVFEGEGYGTPTDLRYCINSISLKMTPGASA